MNARIGLVCVSLAGERTDLAEIFHAQALQTLNDVGVEVVNPVDAYTLTGEAVRAQTEACVAAGADAMVYLVGTWILADHVVDAVRELALPFAIWGVPEPASFSSVGANVLRGAFGEMGIAHKLIYGFPDDKKVADQVRIYARAMAVRKELTHARLGLIGGRTISAYPTTADPNQIKRIFGVEVDHIDQLVLLEKARRVPDDVTDALMAQAKERYGSVDVPEDMFRRSVSIYVALKEIMREYDLQMFTVKCIGEFMDHYGSCCLALSMLGDEGVVCGCQCNLNAIISSYMLQRLSGQPCFFGDINTVLPNEGVARLINCGSIPATLARGMESVKIVPQYEYMGKGRGVCTFFCMKEGPVTFGTLGREQGSYVMNIAGGEAFVESEETLASVRTWAQGFVKLSCDPMEFYRNLRSNHSVMCYGDVKAELLELCDVYDIQPETTHR